MKRLQWVWQIIFIFLVYSCTSKYENFDEILPEGSIKLRYNVQKQIDDFLSLEIISIIDTRCPIGATCSEAGEVTLNLRILSTEGVESTDLHFSELSHSVKNIDTIMNYRIEVVKVTPMPYLNKPIETDSIYSVIVLVDKI
jgi:hypothetical protein